MSRAANHRLAGALFLGAGAMLGAAYAAVPLYAAFCRATGYGGTTQVAKLAPALRGERRIEVHLDANVGAGLAWSFAPEASSVTLRTGETATVYFKVHNREDKTVSAVATYNVSPDSAGAWFDKISCFCFSEQTLGAGETAEWPVVFFLDPKLEKDHAMDGVGALTLSYTLFASQRGGKPVALAPDAQGPKL